MSLHQVSHMLNTVMNHYKNRREREREKSYLNPRHVVLLHLFHLLLDSCVKFVLKLEGLHVVHVAVAVEQIALKGSTGLLLGISGLLGFVLVISVTRVPVKERNELTIKIYLI